MSRQPQRARPWRQLALAAPPAQAARLSELLETVGALSVTLSGAGDEPLYEPPPGATPLWGTTRVVGLFGPEADLRRVLARLRAALAPQTLPPHRIARLSDRVWEREWIRYAEPVRIGRRLWVCPSAFAPPPAAAVCVRLDPGLAFGSGTHPSTRLCLEWLESHPLHGARVVDYGCGSGILAIAALKLGARVAWAVDHDPQALAATRENARSNGVAEMLRVAAPAELPRALAAEVVIANILAQPLTRLAPCLSGLLHPDGRLVLSGVLQAQAAEVAAAYEPWLRLHVSAESEGWVRLSGRRSGRGAAAGTTAPRTSHDAEVS